MLADLDRLVDSLRERSGEVAGTLNVGGPLGFGRHYLAAAIADFQSLHPRLKVSLTLSDVLSAADANRFDMIVHIGSLADSSMVAYPIAPNTRFICAAPAYLGRRPAPREPRELAAARLHRAEGKQRGRDAVAVPQEAQRSRGAGPGDPEQQRRRRRQAMGAARQGAVRALGMGRGREPGLGPAGARAGRLDACPMPMSWPWRRGVPACRRAPSCSSRFCRHGSSPCRPGAADPAGARARPRPGSAGRGLRCQPTRTGAAAGSDALPARALPRSSSADNIRQGHP